MLVTGASAAATADPSTVVDDETRRVTFATDTDVPDESTAEFSAPGRASFRARVDASPASLTTPLPPGTPSSQRRRPRLRATFAVPADAPQGPRTVVVTNTDGGQGSRDALRSSDVSGAGQADSPSVVLAVRTGIDLRVARTGTRTYRFTGSTCPGARARP